MVALVFFFQHLLRVECVERDRAKDLSSVTVNNHNANVKINIKMVCNQDAGHTNSHEFHKRHFKANKILYFRLFAHNNKRNNHIKKHFRRCAKLLMNPSLGLRYAEVFSLGFEFRFLKVGFRYKVRSFSGTCYDGRLTSKIKRFHFVRKSNAVESGASTSSNFSSILHRVQINSMFFRFPRIACPTHCVSNGKCIPPCTYFSFQFLATQTPIYGSLNTECQLRRRHLTPFSINIQI